MIDGVPDDLDETLVREPRETAAVLLDRLVELGWTVAVAESLTGGMVVSSLVDVAGASRAVRGGIVAYATDLKRSVLGVDPALLEAHGAVHPRVARQMARGVRDVLGRDGSPADVGIATTGVAGPEMQDGQPVGTVHIAVSTPLGTRVDSLVISGDRDRVRREATHIALRRALAAL
ncbi:MULTISPECIES: CinA family protein [Microbacterium]|jgi:nicotinamide-nucleotide amidase|uniref:CinA family protein n=1 Tax=Microbacterium mcarthurae TaxID=3035918 RepID=A0ABW9GJH8_9MICO|nr:CinA family protein [Microbacterium sp. ACRRU]MCG7417709.1 CinA family protein [Microbacterium sp. ACRRU]